MADRLMRLENEADSRFACRLAGRAVEDPNLRGHAFVETDAPDAGTDRLLRGALARTRVLVPGGTQGLLLCGDLFSLFCAGRELEALDSAPARDLGRRVRTAAAALDDGPAPLRLGTRTFEGGRPVVLGIVNVTPDSFSDGGQFRTSAAAAQHGLALLAAGADALDVGGESTRPRGRTYGEGARTVSVQEEIDRVAPVLEALRARIDAPLSVDTRKSEVARAALRIGVELVNDVTGLLHDPALGVEVARTDAALCLMHVPADIEQLPHEQPSEDVVGDVLAGLRAAVARASAAGVQPSRLVLDPGLGFGKTPSGNFLLLRHLECVAALGFPVMVGASRKSSFARAASGDDAAPLPMAERLPASLAAAVAAYRQGARVLRVHDVAETVRALRVARAVRDST